jgi:hypothetical protein
MSNKFTDEVQARYGRSIDLSVLILGRVWGLAQVVTVFGGLVGEVVWAWESSKSEAVSLGSRRNGHLKGDHILRQGIPSRM